MDTRNTAAETIAKYKQTIATRTAVIVALSFVIVLLGALAFYLGSLPKKMPYVIELSSDGEAYYHANTVELLRDWTPSDATQRYFISHYVMQLRGVSSDNNVNKENASSVFSRSLEDATSEITQWYADNNPITRSQTEYVLIPSDDLSVVLYAENIWKVTWRETTYRKSDGTITSDKQYEGLFTVSFYTPDTERRKRENPIGMYITDYTVSYIGSLM
jgi:type IV secretory pathway TrbF-like protein